MISATGVMMSPAMFMSRMARSKIARLGQRLPGYHVARLRNHAMPSSSTISASIMRIKASSSTRNMHASGISAPLPRRIGNYTPVPGT